MRMRWPTIVVGVALIVGLSPAVQASTTVVYRTSGTVSVMNCPTCHLLVDQLDARLPGEFPTVHGNGTMTDVVEGALRSGGNYFVLTLSGQATPGTELSITFYNAAGFPIQRFARTGNEAGWIPSGAASAEVELQFGTFAEYTYTELLRT
jgi:hypothetical protein